MSKPIPLELNLNWWWYKLKNSYLNYLLNKNSNFKEMPKILEIGPGMGNNLRILEKYGKVSVIEIEEHFIKQLIQNQQIASNKIFRTFDDIENSKFEIIVALDVLEHVEDTKLFLENINKVLKDNGLLIISVPAYESLWSNHDVNLKHIKRYNWKLIHEEISPLFNIQQKLGMNYLLLPLRFIQIKLFKNLSSTEENSKVLNSIFLLVSKIESFLLSLNLNPKFGLSLFVLATKKTTLD